MTGVIVAQAKDHPVLLTVRFWSFLEMDCAVKVGLQNHQLRVQCAKMCHQVIS